MMNYRVAAVNSDYQVLVEQHFADRVAAEQFFKTMQAESGNRLLLSECVDTDKIDQWVTLKEKPGK